MNPWDITRREHDPLGGPDIVHFADGHRMAVPPAAPDLNSLAADFDPTQDHQITFTTNNPNIRPGDHVTLLIDGQTYTGQVES